ncbi:hypothetical protein ACWEVP_33430 [Amycolatopsis sp. NPDC003865]
MRWTAFAGCLALLGLTLTAGTADARGHDPGRVVLGAHDGWGAGTTGGEGNVDAADRPRSCEDFADPAYSLPAYLAAYDPATWRKVEPSGPLEEARARSRANQAAQVVVDVGPNTTVHGLGAPPCTG